MLTAYGTVLLRVHCWKSIEEFCFALSSSSPALINMLTAYGTVLLRVHCWKSIEELCFALSSSSPACLRRTALFFVYIAGKRSRSSVLLHFFCGMMLSTFQVMDYDWHCCDGSSTSLRRRKQVCVWFFLPMLFDASICVFLIWIAFQIEESVVL